MPAQPTIQTTTTSYKTIVEPKYEGGYPLTSEYYTYYPTWFNGKQQQQVGQTTTVVEPTMTTTGSMSGQFNDIVIGGVSGRFPESDNVEEFAQNLYNGVDMVTEGERRWPTGLYGLPKRNGTIKDITRFDAQFFGIHPKQVDNMDPQLRILLEVAYEAIFDAGFNPTELRGTRTGVFIGASGSEALHAFSTDAEQLSGYSMTGCASSMLANRLSFFFDFKGPSYVVDTACSSSLVALDSAINALKTGLCDYAIVGGVNILAKPNTSLQFQRLGMLSQDGTCKSFDASGKGYVRSETVGAIFLQKKTACRRFYAKILHSKINTDGAKERGITFPSGEMQARLLREIYAESDIDPALVTYVEAHGTGTKAGDPQELNSIADVFTGPRVQRSVPLFIGSTKSNMGHPEPASGIAALVKMLISIQRGVIPANLHYQEPNQEIPALIDGRLQVVNEHTRFRGGLMALNSFGFGGANAHVLLQPNSDYIMSRLGASSFWNQDISEYVHMPRLFPFCARTQEGLEEIFQHVQQNKHDLAAQFLMQPNSTWPVSTHPFRGYTVLNGQQQVQEIRQVVPMTTTTTETGVTTNGQKPVWWIFSGMGTQWHGMGQELMKIDTFRQSIVKSTEYLKPYGINLWEIIHSKVPTVYERTLHSFVGIAAVQIALVDCLRHAGVVPDGIIGHSVGELGCAYADSCFTHEETILAAYHRGRCIEEAKLPPGAMAAVGLTWEECQRRCPSGVVPACHNSLETVTISGPKTEVMEFVEQLTREGVFAKLVETGDVAFHSYFMNSIAMKLKQALDTVIRAPRQRTGKWISTSIPEQRWETELARFSSPEYHVNNLCSPVLFQEALKFVPTNAVVVEIAPHALLQAVLRRSLTPNVTLIPLMKKDVVHHLEHFWTQFGRMYIEGINVDAVKLLVPYGREHTIYPVPVSTGFISHLVRWDHQQQWKVPSYLDFAGKVGDEFTTGANVYKYNIDVAAALEDAYLTGHQIDGRIIYPATGYLHLVWKTFAKMNGFQHVEKFPVGFENVEIHRATILAVRDQQQTMVPKKITFGVSVTPNNGFFEVIESGSVVVTGRVFVPETPVLTFGQTAMPFQWTDRQRTDLMVQEEIYRELRLRGYEYQHEFQPIIKADIEGSTGELIWNGKWISFMDGMLQMSVLGQKRGLLLPTRIRSIRIDPVHHMKTLNKLFRVDEYGMKTLNKYWYEQGKQFATVVPTTTVTPFMTGELETPVVGVPTQHYVVPVVFDPFTNTTVAGGIEIVGLHATSAPRRQFFQPTVVERVNFVPYVEKHFDDDYLFVDTYEKENGEHEPIVIQNVDEPTVKQQREFYEFYLNECKRYVNHIIKRMEHTAVQWTGASMPMTTFVPIQPTPVPVAFQPFAEIMRTGGKLLTLLQQIATIEVETGVPVSTYFYKVQKVFTEGHAYWHALEHDLVLNYLNKRSYYLKSFLDTVLENVCTVDYTKQPRLKVLEISPSFSHFMGVKVNNFIRTHPQLSALDYHYAPTIMGGEQPEEFFAQINQQVPFPIQRVDWNFGIRQANTKVVIAEPPTHLRDFDLVIFNNALSTLLPHFEGEHEMKMWMKTVAERIMKPTGFMFVHEFTNSFEIVNGLNYLEQVVLRQQPVQPVMPMIHNQIFPVYKYQTEPQWCKLIEDAGFFPVALKSDTTLSTMILYRIPTLYQTMKTYYPVTTVGTPVVYEEKILIDDMDQFTWVEKVKLAMANRQLERIWLISEKQPNCGIVGLVNCLRREMGGDRIRCIFIADKKPIICTQQFIPSIYMQSTTTTTPKTHVVQWTQMFDRIRKADLIMNVFRNGKWGSFRHVFDGPQIEQHIFESERALWENCFPHHIYRHGVPTTVGCTGTTTTTGCTGVTGTPLRNAYINWLSRGDLSSLSWLQSPEPVVVAGETGKLVCQVSYSALNFRDIMLATGKLVPEAIPGYYKMQDGLLGMEFSGVARDNRQKRYMGMVPAKGLATTVVVEPKYVWEVPREWTLEQAATVPVAYSTAYYAMVVRGGLRRGDSVLIHAGSGAVGQAAIAIALSYDCAVYVTVSSDEKRAYLKSLFPGKLRDECFANSRDIFFEKHIMQMTQGRGVDVVLNSLAEDKLQASVRVLAQHGRFLEIGKFDLNKNSQLGMSVFLKNVSFHGILVDSLFETENNSDWKRVYQLVEEGIRTGVVRPLNSTIFEKHQIEDAFRFMAQGKHIGKVLVKVWEPTEFCGEPTVIPTVTGFPRVWFSPMKTFIITGGLGGFGLELTQWIVERGARRVILTSRSGVRTGYQARKLRTLQEEFGCQIQVSSFDVKEEGECICLIKEAIQMSPEKKIGGIFHLAAVLEDGIFENQTLDRFKRVNDVKYLGSYNLDKYTRSIEGCMDDAAYFIVFSSVSCGRGNAGQTNYGFANSAMERICEYRRRDGKHALAIQWGAIGDVGLIGENDIVVGGTMPQRIVSCLKTLEHLMLKSTETMRDTGIWSTFVPAERVFVQPTVGGAVATGTKNLVEIIANIMGIKDIKQVRSEQMTLGELGLDSLMGVEIKQVLEQMFNVQMTVREVQQLTFEKIRGIQQTTVTATTTTTTMTTGVPTTMIGEPMGQFKQTTTVFGQQQQQTKKFNYLMPTRIIERLNPVEFGAQQVPVVVIHPIEGHVNMLKSWAKHMKYPVFGVQYTEDAMKCETIEQLADFYWQHIEKELLVQCPRVHLCGYSFGSSVAFEMAAKRANRVASLCLLDGSHSYVTAHVNTYKSKYQLENINQTESEALFTFAQQYAPIMSRVQFIDELLALPTFDHRVKYTVGQLLTKSQFQFEPVDLEQSARSFVKKLFMSYKYQPMQPLRLSEILLIKSGQRSNLVQTTLGEDYGLSQVFNGKIKVQVVDGDHRSFLEANNGFQVASILNEYLLCCF